MAFTEGGITHRGVYGALVVLLETAERYPRVALRGYVLLLRAQRGKKVTAVWADGITANAEYVRVNRP